MLVSEVLAKKGNKVFKILGDKPVIDAISGMAAFKVGAVMVVDGSDRVVGIFTERDVTRIIAAHGATVLESPVSQHMTLEPKVCSPADSVQSVLERMTHGRFRHMPVFEDGQLLGIISIRDLVSQQLEQVEWEAEELRAYVTAA